MVAKEVVAPVVRLYVRKVSALEVVATHEPAHDVDRDHDAALLERNAHRVPGAAEPEPTAALHALAECRY
jgi:hypothetical protein